ncbi:MAG: flagellar basal body L-ring protein FlgH [Planctomycetota bacterium]|nr:flagellar basal body L-ring protein FlgH [Planctomycetota bacterium]
MKRSFLMVIVLALAAVPAARAGSIWGKASSGATVLRVYEDDTARRVGDVLTIVISEHSVIDNTSKRTDEKTTDRALTASGTVNLNDLTQWWGKPNGPGGSVFTLPNISTTAVGHTKLVGQADLSADRNNTDRITVTVHDVLPNGNLVIMGSRRRNTHGDEQVICISGIVRPSDITFNNTVGSDQVAEFHIVNVLKGPENQFTKPGWMGQILNCLSLW